MDTGRVRDSPCDPLDSGILRQQQLVRTVLDPAGHAGIGRTAVRRVVLESAIFRRVVRRRDDDSIRRPIARPLIPREDRAGDDRRRREAVVLLDDRLHAIRGEHFESRLLGWRGQRVRVLADVERTVDAVLPSIFADGLGDRRDVRRGETPIERRPPVAAGAERDALTDVPRVGHPVEEFTLERTDIDQRSRGGPLARERVRHSYPRHSEL